MSDEIRNVRTSQPSMRPEMMPAVEEASSSKLPWIILAVVVVVLVVLGFVFKGKLFGPSGSSQEGVKAMSGKPSGYQAVFLTNGQVYFGKMAGVTDDTITMKDIFYLQVIQQQPLQGTTEQQQQAEQQPQISLVKLGNELHGPVDEMHINRTQVLFYEDLKEDGRVVQAIKEYKANPQGATGAQGGAQQQQQQPPAVNPPKQ